jgi:formate dehydrogenase major subunit
VASALAAIGFAATVDSVCPYCGVGCQLTYHVKDDGAMLVVTGRDGPANESRLCVKGRFGFDYVHTRSASRSR